MIHVFTTYHYILSAHMAHVSTIKMHSVGSLFSAYTLVNRKAVLPEQQLKFKTEV